MATDVANLPDWGVPPTEYTFARKAAVVTVLVAPLLVFAVLLTLVDGPWDVAAVAVSVGWVLFLAANEWALSRRVIRSARVEPADARFTNLVKGLANTYGMPVPDLGVIDDDRPNALVVRWPKPRLLVTRGLLDAYTRTEQEAVAAHCLYRLGSGGLDLAHVAAALGRTGSRFAPRVGDDDDIRAASMTRYPPALASAIAKAKPASGIAAPFWFVAHDVSHRHPRERIERLQDL